jgi:Bacterial SH3 domain
MCGKRLTMCLLLVGGMAGAQQLDVPFHILEDDQAAGCLSAYVTGLDPNGDGFLAVRTGPGTGHRKIDEIHNGDLVRTCATSGAWVGIYYGKPRRVGWVHGKWLVDSGAG